MQIRVIAIMRRSKYIKWMFLTIAIYYPLIPLWIKRKQYEKNHTNAEEEKEKMSDFLSGLLEKKKEKVNNIWNEHRRMNIIFEFVCILLIICFIVAGIFFDNEVKNGLIRIRVDEFDSFIIAILEIQATISTLTIALVALISNNVSESYMGIAVSHYYLNIRPFIFKQNIIIYSVLGLLSANILLYIFKCYNLVLYVFAATIVLIILSAYEIYYLFRGVAVADEEIELFILQFMDKPEKKYYKEKVGLFTNLVNDWADKSAEQNQIDYDEYKDVFLYSLQKILLYNTDESLSALRDNCKKEIYSLLHTTNDIVQGRGIELLREIYDQMWAFVISSDYQRKNKKSFDLFSEVFDALSGALKRMSIDTIEEVLEWRHMSDVISRVTFCLMSSDEKVEYSSELQNNIRFSSLIGYILRYKEHRKQEVLEPVINRWGRALYEPFLDLAYNIPTERKKEFLQHKCKICFYYCKGFIDNKYISVVKDNIFYRAMSNAYGKTSKIEILYYLSIDCYLYYLAEKESELCIEPDLKKMVSELLEDKKVRSLNEYYYSLIESQLKEYSELESDLQIMLYGCEWFPKFENGKTLIMGNVVREFYIFSILIVSCKYSLRGQQLKIYLKDMPFVYINQFLEGQEKNTKKYLRKFYMLFGDSRTNDSDPTIDSKVEQMYEKLEQALKSLYKKEEVKKAKEEQEKYNTETNKDAVVVNIQKKITDHMKNTFGKLIVQKGKPTEKWTATFNLLDCNLFTNMINENVVDDMYSDVDANFIAYIISEFLRRELVFETKRSEFKNDIDYINFLNKQKIGILMGSEYVLKNIDYTYTNEFNAFAQTCKCIYAGYYKDGALALKAGSLQIRLNKVNVSIRPLSLKDVDLDYNEKDKTYFYNITNDITLPFQKDELLVYINNKRKILNISMEVEIIANNRKIGTLVKRDDNE